MAQRVHSLNRPNMVSVGTIVWLSQELMFFAGLFAMYFVSKANSGGDWPAYPVHLNVPFAVTITVILVASSWTCQLGVFAAEQGDVFSFRRWYVLSAAMGATFLVGVLFEYYLLVQDGVTIDTNVYASVFYIATGFHALHVTGGVIAFIVIVMRSTMSRFTPAQATAAIVVSYYWHFVDVVWIGLFVTIYFIQ